MKIVVKLQKAGQVLAQTEFDAGDDKGATKRIGKAFKQFRDEHYNVSLFDEDVYLTFEKTK